jgi:hypothetical protein
MRRCIKRRKEKIREGCKYDGKLEIVKDEKKEEKITKENIKKFIRF